MKINNWKEHLPKDLKSKLHINVLFNNDRFVMVFSVLVALVLWFSIAMSDTDTDSHQLVDNIPIDVTLSQAAKDDNLMVFEILPDTKASVSITGNRRLLSQVTSKDIQIIATQAGGITAPGNYQFVLTARQTGLLTDYEISQSSVYPREITVTVDRYREKEFTVEDNKQYKIDSNYFNSSTELNPGKVTISGPESVISKIDKVVAACDVSETLTSTKTVTVPLKLYDVYGAEITGASLQRITMSATQTEANIIVMKKMVMPVTVSFVNNPSGWSMNNSRVTITPNTLEIAGLEDVFKTFKEINLGTLDFSQISLTDNKKELQVELPTGCKNLSNTSSATVSVNTSGMTQKTITVDKFNFVNVPAGKTATPVTKSLTIEVIGDPSEIDALTADNIIAKVDLKNNQSFTGHTEMPLNFVMQGATNCWVYGSYKISIGVE